MKEQEQYKDSKIFSLDPEELQDLLLSIGEKINKRVAALADNMRSLQYYQEKKERILERLAELNFKGD